MNASPTLAARALPEGLVAAIDRDGEIPIGVQLAWALRSCIRDGRFAPAQRLPGLRELADAVGVNANTVRAVYQRLEREGLIDSRQGSGTFVAARPLAAASSRVSAIAADAAREALAAGADPREVAAALYVAPGTDRVDPGTDRKPLAAIPSSGAGVSEKASAEKASGAPEEASGASDPAQPARELTHRRELRAQIATLERAIAAMEAEHPGAAPAPEDAIGGRGGPALLSAQELEQVRSGLVRRLATVQAAIDERATAAVGASARAATTAATAAGATTVTGPNKAATNKAATKKAASDNAVAAAKAAKQARKPAKPNRPRAPAITPPRTAPC